MEQPKGSAIEKALQILKFFKEGNRPQTIQELSSILGINRTTVHRTVQTLLAEGFLQQDIESHKVSLGGTVLALGNALTRSLRSRSIVEAARPHIEQLRSNTGCAVTLEMLAGNQNILLCILKNDRVGRFAGEVGDIMPWHAAAGAKATLAFLSEKDLDPILRQNMFPYTPNTITEVSLYLEELVKVRKSGYATDIGETQLGVTAIAAPFFNYNGKPAGAVIALDVGLDLSNNKNPIFHLIKETALAISKENFAPRVMLNAMQKSS